MENSVNFYDGGSDNAGQSWSANSGTGTEAVDALEDQMIVPPVNNETDCLPVPAGSILLEVGNHPVDLCSSDISTSCDASAVSNEYVSYLQEVNTEGCRNEVIDQCITDLATATDSVIYFQDTVQALETHDSNTPSSQIVDIDENAQDQSNSGRNLTEFGPVEFSSQTVASNNSNGESAKSSEEGNINYGFNNLINEHITDTGDSNDEYAIRFDDRSLTSSVAACDDQSEISENSLMTFPGKINDSAEGENSSDMEYVERSKSADVLQNQEGVIIPDIGDDKDLENSESCSISECTPSTSSGYIFPAENLFEYQWPAESGAEWYMIQEQICEFLHVKSFKRKYPELLRRIPGQEEREFLRMRGVITETQCDLGLTALRADEVHDLMMRDYPVKYQEYATVIHDKEKEKIKEKLKSYNAPKMDKVRYAAFLKKAVKSSCEFNSHFQRERREDRRAYVDLQTMAIHYPKSKRKVLPPEFTKPSPYPVSLIPGQYQDYYKTYTPEELKYLPLGTAIYGPPKDLSQQPTTNIIDDGDLSNDSASEDYPQDVLNKDETFSSQDLPNKLEELLDSPDRVCRVCLSAVNNGRIVEKNSSEELVQCSECCTFGHPSCLDLPPEMVTIIKTYAWQCMDCKTCVECMDPYDEDKMLFCDQCDRGYHTFCVGLKGLPTGRWECRSCCQDTPKRKKPRKERRDKKKETPVT